MIAFLRRLFAVPDIAPELDHLPFDEYPCVDWRAHKLQEAALRYGKVFKCASQEFAREVWVRDHYVEAKPLETPRHNTQIIPLRRKS